MFQLKTVIVPQNLCGMFWNKKSTETSRIFHENKLFKMVIWAHFSSWKLIGNECKKNLSKNSDVSNVVKTAWNRITVIQGSKLISIFYLYHKILKWCNIFHKHLYFDY